MSELPSTPPSQSSHIIAQYSTSSLHLVYPLLVRPSNCQPSSSSTTSTITNKILPTTYQTDDSDNEEEEDSDNDLDSNNSDPQQDPFHPHLQEYLHYLRSGSRLNDGVENITRFSVIATIGPGRKNAYPWFAKVMEIHAEDVEVIWLHRLQNSSKFYYAGSVMDHVPKDAIICNGVEFVPKFGDKLIWKLVTPLTFLRTLNSDNIPTIQGALSEVEPAQEKKKGLDITGLVFHSPEDFRKFFSSY